MRILLLIMATLAMSSIASGQADFYTLDSISPAQLKNVHSILQYEKSEFAVTDADKAIEKVRKTITVLDKQGDDQLFFYCHTDEFRKLEDIQLTILDKIGLPQKKYIKKDFVKQAYDGNLVYDGMYYYLKIIPSTYPITVEYSYTVKHNGILKYPSFDIQSPEQYIKYAQHIILVPTALGLRYKNQLTNIKPIVQEINNIQTYTWEVKNIPAIMEEPGSVADEGALAKVLIAPNKFKLGNYAGEMNTWENFCNWGYRLAASSLDLSETSKQNLRAMVQNTTDPKEKARILYRNLQDNFRYVSIQLGIGGFKPFPASFTEAKKYGDCKALSNYMQACLDAVDIKSYQAWINAGRNKTPADPAFPLEFSNHVILCVPLAADTLWLECTSQETQFGELGNFTENRNAMLLAPTGGIIVPTPASKASQNQIGQNTTIKLLEDGSGQVHTNLNATGEYRLTLNYILQNQAVEDQKEGLENFINMPTPDKFELQLPSGFKEAVLQTGLQLQYEKIPSFSAGSKMFLNQQINKIWTKEILQNKYRALDYFFSNPFIKSDTCTYFLPLGFGVESLPESKTFSFKYGNYHTNLTYNKTANTVTSIATLQLNQHKIPAADYTEMVDFFEKVVGNETNMIVIKKE